MSLGAVMWTVLFIGLCGFVSGLLRIDPLVSTKVGLIRGLRSDHGYAKFLGVPYALVNRSNPFGPAVAHPAFDDIFEAYESNACPQVSSNVAIGIIDCLTMNIYVPSAANSQNRLPVLVWIHGGTFVEKSADREASDPNFLLKNDVIVVAINYRIGAYGFMCLDIPEVPGNQGLKDQVLALRWINENIEAFGGDASKITVFGESAGAMSSYLHLFSSYEKLYQRAIIQSGPALGPWLPMKSDSTIPLRLSAALDYNTTDIHAALDYLSSINALTIAKLAYDLNIASFSDDHKPQTLPCIEKEFEGVENFITEHPLNIKSSKVRSTSVIIGYNSNELAFQYETADAGLFTSSIFEEYLSMGFNLDDNDALDEIRHFYIGDEEVSENVKWNLADFVSDFILGHPIQRMVEALLNNSASNVYRYIFSYSGGRNMVKVPMQLNSTGATHSDELGYLFDVEMFKGEITPEDQLMVDRITTLWTNFAKTGDPTPELSELLPVKWEPVMRTIQPYLDIDSQLVLKSRPFHERMAFWDLFYKQYEQNQKFYKGSSK